MTSGGDPPAARRSSAPAARRQAKFWNFRYRTQPKVFGDRPSPFLRWLLHALEGRRPGRQWIELGSGYGRDLKELRDRGLSARGIDLSRVGTSIARRAGLEAEKGHALRLLARQRSASVDVVFSNLFFNMEFLYADHDRLFAEVHRVLAPGGFHAYCARSTSDALCGKGTNVGPDTYDFRPDGPVMHFFSRRYAARLRKGRFRSVRTWEGPGRERIPTRVLYVLERKPPLREERRRAGGRLTP